MRAVRNFLSLQIKIKFHFEKQEKLRHREVVDEWIENTSPAFSY
jgi:hypothetical protein